MTGYVYLRILRQKRRKQGRCYQCGRRAVAGSVWCLEHRDLSRQKARVRWAQQALRTPRRCRWCQRPLSVEEQRQRLCYHRPSCLNEHQRRYSRDHAKARWKSIRLTSQYQAAHRQAASAYQARHLVLGLCVRCPEPADPGVQHCAHHRRGLIKAQLRCRGCRGGIPLWWRRQGRRFCLRCRVARVLRLDPRAARMLWSQTGREVPV